MELYVSSDNTFRFLLLVLGFSGGTRLSSPDVLLSVLHASPLPDVSSLVDSPGWSCYSTTCVSNSPAEEL